MSTYTVLDEVSSLCLPMEVTRGLAYSTDYLEYKLGTIKVFNGRNNFLSSYFVQIPYYIFLGCSRSRDASKSLKSFEVEAGNILGQGRGGLMTPTSPFMSPHLGSMTSVVPVEFSLGPSVIQGKEGLTESIRDVGAPLSPFHYQLRKVSPCTDFLAGNRAHIDRGGEYRILRRRSMNNSEHIYTAG